jgi:NAD(P)-dependent dehydrogenase (short-subunit alcohol dehydrogenase family)
LNEQNARSKQAKKEWAAVMNVKNAVIIGASGGIGGAFASLLEAELGITNVIRLSRSEGSIDLKSEDSIAAAAASIQARGITPDLVIVAAGLLHDGARGPEKSIRDLNADWMLENYHINAVGPALVAKHFLPIMPRKGRSVFAALSARVGSISDNRLGGWHGYRASKAALNMLIRNLSIEWQRRNPDAIITAIHPGTVNTALSAPFGGGSDAPGRFTPQQSAAQILDVLGGLQPSQSGQLFAYDGQLIPA